MRFNQNISDWDVSNVKSMSSMFCGARVFNQDLSAWNISKVEKMDYMFYNSEIRASSWDLSHVKEKTMVFGRAWYE
jgi:hypothetical protein